LIQASDVADTIQHWHIYSQWNERFFMECHKAYKESSAVNDPSEFWYEGELGSLTSTTFRWPESSSNVAASAHRVTNI